MGDRPLSSLGLQDICKGRTLACTDPIRDPKQSLCRTQDGGSSAGGHEEHINSKENSGGREEGSSREKGSGG